MLINNESPLERNLYLEEASDNTGGVIEGQGSELVTDPASTGESTEAFYTYKGGDGTETAFKDATEMDGYLKKKDEDFKQGAFRYADYTRKSQAAAAAKRSFEADKTKHEVEYTTFLQNKQEHDKIEKYLKTLSPERYNQLKQGASGQSRQFQDPRVDQILKDFQADKDDRKKASLRQEEEIERNKAFESLSQSYGDFDKESILGMVKELEEIPPEDQQRAFMELLHFARKGRISPAELERIAAEKLRKKEKVTTPMGSTTSTPNTGNKSYKNLKEAYKAAKEKYG